MYINQAIYHSLSASFLQYQRLFLHSVRKIWEWRLIGKYVTVSLSFPVFSFSPSIHFVFLSSSVSHTFSLRLAALEFILCSCCGIVAPHSRYLVSQSWLPFPLLIGSKQHGCLGWGRCMVHRVGTFLFFTLSPSPPPLPYPSHPHLPTTLKKALTHD